MIFGLILILAIVIFLAFFIGKNLTFVSTIWFFKTYEGVNISVIVFASFAAGVIFALACILIYKLAQASRVEPEVENEKQKLRRQKQQLKTEKQLAKLAEKNAAREREKIKAEVRAELQGNSSSEQTVSAEIIPSEAAPEKPEVKEPKKKLFGKKASSKNAEAPSNPTEEKSVTE